MENMSWILIENMGDQFETVLNAADKESAIEEAKNIWDKLSTHDKKRRNEFYIVHAEIENGIVNLDTATETVNLLA